MLVYLFAGLLTQSALPGQYAATTVAEVVVDGVYPEFRLRVDIGGDLDVDTLVLSGAPPMYCSGQAFRYAPGPARQCWLRARANTTVRLRAEAPGGFGSHWTVDWRGCDPVDDGRACEITVTEEAQVGARFRRS